MNVKRGHPVEVLDSQNLDKETVVDYEEGQSSFRRHDPSSILSPTYVKMIRDSVFKEQG